MTDLEKLTTTLQDLGISFEITGPDPFQRAEKFSGFRVRIDEGYGYSGYFVEFTFSVDGKFIDHSIRD